jgi:hypothetical protein
MQRTAEPKQDVDVAPSARSSISDIARGIKSDIGMAGPRLQASSVPVTKEMYERIKNDPKARSELEDRMRRENVGHDFTVRAPVLQPGGFYTIDISIKSIIRPSENEVARDVSSDVNSFGKGYTGSSTAISKDVFTRLSNPKELEEFRKRLERENPGFRFSLQVFPPTLNDPFYSINVSARPADLHVIPKKSTG